MTNSGYSSTGRTRLKYDAHGRLVPNNTKKSGVFSFFVGFLIPYLLINGLVLMFVISTPKISFEDPDTKDYKTATMKIQISSLIPLSSVKASLEGTDVDIEKQGGSYLVSVSDNGTLNITAKSINGMQKVENIPVNLLDKTAPVIDTESVVLGAGYLEFQVADTQSGIDYDNIYGIDGDGDNIKPTEVNKTTGVVTFSMKSDTLQVYVSDLAGNQVPANFSVN